MALLGGHTGYAGYANQSVECAATEKPSQIDGRCADLERANEEIRTLVAGLQIRLQNVLVPQMKGEATSGANTPKPVISPLAERLDNVHSSLMHSASLMRDLIDRLAV